MPSSRSEGILLNALDEPALLIGDEGDVADRNVAAERLLASLSEGVDGDWLAEPIATFLAGENPQDEFIRELPDPQGVRRLRVRLLRHPAFAGHILVTLKDLSEEQRFAERQALMADILGVLNRQVGQTEVVGSILARIKAFTGLEAVGIRIRRNEDYPYYVTQGFGEEFVRAENHLCARDAEGALLRDADGNPVLECMCGNVIRGRTDSSFPFFTEGGSFWSNGTTKLLASTSEADRQSRTRNRCNGEGYESVALILLRCGAETVGLLQLNDRRPDRFTLEDIEFFERVGAGVGVALGRGRAEARARHVSQLLAVLRDVHRLTASGSEREAMLRDVRECLAQGLEWGRAWIALIEADGSGGKVFADAATPVDATPPPCVKGVLGRQEVTVLARPCAECEGCRFAGPEGSRSVVASIGHGDHVYGALGLEIPEDVDLDADERELIEELAGDIAHALLRMDLDAAEREAALERREHALFLRQLLDAIPAPVFYKDAQGVYLGCNRAFEEAFGLSREELRGKTVFDIAPREIAQRYHEMDAALYRERGEQTYEWVIPRRDGTRRDVLFTKATFDHADGGLGGIVGAFIDITERKQSEARYRALVDNQLEAVCRWAPDTTLTYANEAFCRRLGLAPEEVVGRRIVELVHPDEAPGLEAHFADLCRIPRVTTYEDRTLLPNGGAAWMEWTDCPIFDEDGELVEFQSVGRDVTERRLAEHVAREAETLRATRSLAAGVAHNFNNLMSGILGFGSLIQGRLEELGEPLDDARKLAECVHRASRLAQDLLTWTSGQARTKQRISLSELLRSIDLQVREGLPDRVALVTSCRRGEARVEVPVVAVVNAFRALCRNAVEAMPEGGTLTLAGDGEPGAARQAPPGRVEIQVRDTGRGLSAETRSRIFDPFFSSKSTVGVGLSLPLAQRTVAQAGGEIRVESEPGKGSTFYVYLPLAEEVSPKAE